MGQVVDLSGAAAGVTFNFRAAGGVVTVQYVQFGSVYTVVGVDKVIGSGFGDTFYLSANTDGAGFPTFLIEGGGGSDQFGYNPPTISSPSLSGISGIEFYQISKGSYVLTDQNVASLGKQLVIDVNNSAPDRVIIDASAISAAYGVSYKPSANTTIFGGSGNDDFSAAYISSDVLHGGAGYDTLRLQNSYTGVLSSDGIEYYDTSGSLITFADANFVGVTDGIIAVTGQSGSVDGAGLSAANRLFFIGAGTNSYTGGGGDDVFSLSASQLAAGTIVGGLGRDTLLVTTTGTLKAPGVSGVEFYEFAAGGPNSLTLTNGNFVGASGPIGVVSGGGDTVVNGASLNAGNALYLFGGAGKDTFSGGSGADTFAFTASSLGATDVVIGGAGADLLLLSTPGVLSISGVSGVEFFKLADGGANTLVLRDSNFTGIIGGQIGVQAGSGGGTLDASHLGAGSPGAPEQVFLFGGAGNDTLKGGAGGDVLVTGGGIDTLIGGTGFDYFLLSSGSGATIQNLTRGIDHIVLSDAGFDLGVNEGQGSGAYQETAAGLLSTDPLGGFTAASQRFAFDQATSHLLYSGTGSNADAVVIATLTGVNTLDYHDLLFTA